MTRFRLTQGFLFLSAAPLRPLAQDLQVSSLEPEAVRLSWQPLSLPSSARSTPSRGVSYQVEALEYPSTQWRPLATEVRDTTYQLKGLQPTKDYSFRVRAVTPSGLTEPTTPVTVTSLPGGIVVGGVVSLVVSAVCLLLTLFMLFGLLLTLVFLRFTSHCLACYLFLHSRSRLPVYTRLLGLLFKLFVY